METHAQHTAPSSQATTFTVGDTVIYPLHGKCQITGLESKMVSGQSITFYKVEVIRSVFARTSRKDPAIWIPVKSAAERGLRKPLSADNLGKVWAILESREYYFSSSDSWSSLQPKLESTIRHEGAEGLAKVISYLYALKKRLIVPTSEVAKMYETVSKLLSREISDATGEQVRAIEERMQKAMRHKVLPDH